MNVGDHIEWRKKTGLRSPHYGTLQKGIVLEIRGRNILVDMMGSTDWLWTPDLDHIARLRNESDV